MTANGNRTARVALYLAIFAVALVGLCLISQLAGCGWMCVSFSGVEVCARNAGRPLVRDGGISVQVPADGGAR